MLLLNEILELRAIEPADAFIILAILRLPGIAESLMGFPQKALDMDFAGWLAAAANRRNDFFFSVVDRQSSEVIGICAYQDIDYRNGRVNVWAALADSKDKANTLSLLASNAFLHLRMEHVAVHCLTEDALTIAAAEMAGFSRDAIFYSRIKKSGKNADVSVYTLLKGEEGDT